MTVRLIEDLAGVEDSRGVERILDRPVESHYRRRQFVYQTAALEQADHRARR